MNLLSLVSPQLNNIYQIKRKCYYSSGWNFLQSKHGLNPKVYSTWMTSNEQWWCLLHLAFHLRHNSITWWYDVIAANLVSEVRELGESSVAEGDDNLSGCDWSGSGNSTLGAADWLYGACQSPVCCGCTGARPLTSSSNRASVNVAFKYLSHWTNTINLISECKPSMKSMTN